MADKQAEAILQTFDRLKAARSNYEQYWQEIAERVLPRASNNFTNRSFVFGDKRNQEVLDATPIKALERFSAAVESMLTPRTQKWHRLRASNPGLMRSMRVKRWFEETTDLLFNYRYSARANFASQANECWMALGAFGTAAMYIDEPRERVAGIRYKSEHIGFTFFLEDYQGKIDTCYRQLFMTVRQAEQKFGRDALPELMQKELDKPQGKDPNQLFEFIHCIKPRKEGDYAAVGEEDMKFTSIYVARDGQKTVKHGGFFTFPIPVSRYVTAPNEVYGRSPAMMALPSIKTLNEQKKTYLKAGHRMVDPVLLAHDDGVLDSFSLRPGAINFGGLNSQGQRLVQPLHDYAGARFAPEFMEMERQDINDLFLVSLFQVLAEENPRMTATEVIERVREKGALLAPTMGRQQSEFLGPLIDRELDILSRQGVLPAMPGELVEAQGEYEVEYDSPLARALRAEEAGGFLRFVEMGGMFAQLTGDPGFLDHIDADEAAPDLAWIMNVPSKWQMTPEKLAAKREARAQAEGIQTAIEAAPAVAGLMKTAQGSGAPAR